MYRAIAAVFAIVFVDFDLIGLPCKSSRSSLAATQVVGKKHGHILESSSIVGRWTWEIKIGAQSGKVTMDVTQVGDRYSATLITPDGETIKPNEFLVKNGNVKIRIVRSKGIFTLTMTHAGKLSGNVIRGDISAIGGPIKTRAKWNALRVREDHE